MSERVTKATLGEHKIQDHRAKQRDQAVHERWSRGISGGFNHHGEHAF